MKHYLISFLLFFNLICFSQPKETDCMFPTNEILPDEFKECKDFKAYFNKRVSIKCDSLERGLTTITCNLYPNGKVLDFKPYYVNVKPNENIIQHISQIKKWNVSGLRKNEYYSLSFRFISFSNTKEYDMNIRWKVDNFIEYDSNSFNNIDKQGLKQDQWIVYNMDTIIQEWTSIFGEESDDSLVESLGHRGIDTIVFKRVTSTGYFNNNKKDSTWHIYKSKEWLHVSRGDSIQFGKLEYIANFKDDSLNGSLKTFYSNGILKSEIEFVNGKANGSINCFYENRKLKYKGIIKSNEDFFKGSEYSKNGYKLKDRNFNYEQTILNWTDLRDLHFEIKGK